MRNFSLKTVPAGQRKLYFLLLEQRCQTWQPVLESANNPETNRPFLSVHSKSVFGIVPVLAAPTKSACLCSTVRSLLCCSCGDDDDDDGGSEVDTWAKLLAAVRCCWTPVDVDDLDA